MDQTAWMIVLTAVIAATTVVYAVVTAWMAWETREARRAQTDPCVVVTVRHDETRPSIVLLVIENIGRGIAYDVSFRTDRPIPAHAFSIPIPAEPTKDVIQDGPFISGIPSLAPGEKRVISWGQYGGLKRAIGDRPITVTAYFRSWTAKVCVAKTYLLEIDSHVGIDAVDPDGARRCAKHLEELIRELQKWSRYGTALRVEQVDTKAEHAAMRGHFEKSRAKSPPIESGTASSET